MKRNDRRKINVLKNIKSEDTDQKEDLLIDKSNSLENGDQNKSKKLSSTNDETESSRSRQIKQERNEGSKSSHNTKDGSSHLDNEVDNKNEVKEKEYTHLETGLEKERGKDKANRDDGKRIDFSNISNDSKLNAIITTTSKNEIRNRIVSRLINESDFYIDLGRSDDLASKNFNFLYVPKSVPHLFRIKVLKTGAVGYVG